MYIASIGHILHCLHAEYGSTLDTCGTSVVMYVPGWQQQTEQWSESPCPHPSFCGLCSVTGLGCGFL